MRYFVFSDFLFSLSVSVTLGLVFGGIYSSLSTVFAFFKELFISEIRVLKAKKLVLTSKINRVSAKSVSFFHANLYDFIFFTLAGTVYILFCYITLDGVFRIYLFIITLFTFLFSKNTLGAFAEKIISTLLTLIYKLWFVLLYFFNLPIKLVIRIFIRLFAPIYRKVEKIVKKKSFNRLICKKKREIRIFFVGMTEII